MPLNEIRNLNALSLDVHKVILNVEKRFWKKTDKIYFIEINIYLNSLFLYHSANDLKKRGAKKATPRNAKE